MKLRLHLGIRQKYAACKPTLGNKSGRNRWAKPCRIYAIAPYATRKRGTWRESKPGNWLEAVWTGNLTIETPIRVGWYQADDLQRLTRHQSQYKSSGFCDYGICVGGTRLPRIPRGGLSPASRSSAHNLGLVTARQFRMGLGYGLAPAKPMPEALSDSSSGNWPNQGCYWRRVMIA
jgi:hypothetical protein